MAMWVRVRVGVRVSVSVRVRVGVRVGVRVRREHASRTTPGATSKAEP